MTTTPEASKQFRTDQVMQGSKAVSLIIPAGMKFVTVLNSTDNKVELYTGSISYESADVRDSLIQSVPYYNQTMPLPNDTYYTLVWRDGGATGVKVVTVIFTVESMNINGSTGAPGTNQNVVITADQANLAKASQLPGNLVGGRLDVNVGNTVSTNTTINGTPNVAVPGGVVVNNWPASQKIDDTTPPNFKVANNTNTDAIPSRPVPCTTINSGKVTGASDAQKVQLANLGAVRGVMLKADKSNVDAILIGNSGTPAWPLYPGEGMVVNVDNMNKVYAQFNKAADNLYYFTESAL